MINKKIIFSGILLGSLSLSLIGCSNSSTNNSKLDIKEISTTEETQKNEENKESSKEETNSTNETSITKIKGKSEYLEKLDKIQEELDLLPEKKDSDAGVTNAMKSFYGVSYEKYDEALNEIYNTLKEGLSPDVMEDLTSKQLEWISLKEENARKEEEKYKGGSFEFVASYTSLYVDTKARCYELVNEYMED